MSQRENLVAQAERVLYVFRRDTGDPGDPPITSTQLAQRIRINNGVASLYLQALDELGCTERGQRSSRRWIEPTSPVTAEMLTEKKADVCRRLRGSS